MPINPTRLTELMREHKLTQQKLGQQLGISQSIISDYLRGKKQPGRGVLEHLGVIFGVSMDYLIGTSPHRAVGGMSDAQSVGMVVQLPIYGSIRARSSKMADDQIIGYEPVPMEDIRGGDYFYLQVAGDSMKDAHIIDGSLVLVRRQHRVDSGDIAVVLVNDEAATVKRVQLMDGQVMLIPANPAETPTIYRARGVGILGKVVEVKIKL